MFTGIVEEIGTVLTIKRNVHSASLMIKASQVLEGTKDGDSIAVNGVCLTVTAHTADQFTVDVMHETMRRSAMQQLSSGSRVNLERAMAADGRFGGHIVTGHIDGTGEIKKVQTDENAVWYTICAQDKIMGLIIEKGSIAVDGISLTVARVGEEDFSVSVIPHTRQKTILPEKKAGDLVNLENDCIGKYVEHLLKREEDKAQQKSGLTKEFLYQCGF